MKISKVVVAGGGVLGSQIAFQAAYCGFDVTIWLRSEGSISRTQPKLDKLKTTYLEAIEAMKTAKSPVDPVWCRGIADFDAFDPAACETDPETGAVLLGDMMISLPACERQGEEYGHGFDREIRYLTVHSVLHLLGYDHVDEGKMKMQMRAREKAIMGDRDE